MLITPALVQIYALILGIPEILTAWLQFLCILSTVETPIILNQIAVNPTASQLYKTADHCNVFRQTKLQEWTSDGHIPVRKKHSHKRELVAAKARNYCLLSPLQPDSFGAWLTTGQQAGNWLPLVESGCNLHINDILVISLAVHCNKYFFFSYMEIDFRF